MCANLHRADESARQANEELAKAKKALVEAKSGLSLEAQRKKLKAEAVVASATAEKAKAKAKASLTSLKEAYTEERRQQQAADKEVEGLKAQLVAKARKSLVTAEQQASASLAVHSQEEDGTGALMAFPSMSVRRCAQLGHQGHERRHPSLPASERVQEEYKRSTRGGGDAGQAQEEEHERERG
jgi:hypothetical protein